MATQRMLAALLALAFFYETAADSNEASCTMALKDGVVEGRVQSKDGRFTERYLGVPFAAPPVGNLRWQAPQPAKPWTGTREATKYSPSCVQEKNAFTATSKVSEDCLYLNVWRPLNSTTTGPLPVMVFIYGGSWGIGSAMFPLYDGAPSTELTEKAVVVTMNYRLAALGFLGSDMLRGGNKSISTGNYGFLDQRMALKWVNDNAEGLNIDRTKVMVFGESAGAASTSSHMTAKNSWPYFTRALMESGPLADWNAENMTQAEYKFTAISKNIGCHNASDVKSCMLNKTFEEVLKASHFHTGPADLTDWSITVDGVEFEDYPEVLASKGTFADVPVLLGTNQDEGTLLSAAKSTWNSSNLENYVKKSFIPEYAEQILQRYPPSNFQPKAGGSPSFWAATTILTDYAMTCSARRSARYYSTKNKNVFLYYYKHELGVVNLYEKIAKKPLGVFHGSELVMVFDVENLLKSKAEKQLSKTFANMWASFADVGDPTPAGNTWSQNVTWPRYSDGQGDNNLVLDTTLSTQTGLKKGLCDFWDNLGFFPIIR